MSNMIIKVGFLTGTDIVDCLIEAQKKAIKFDVAYVEFNFNGIEVSVSPSASIDWGAKGHWDECMGRGNKFVIFS